MAAVFLYIDKPVASLQFDIGTTGQITLESSVPKQIATAPVGGKTRVIIYGLNQSTFEGKFATINADVADITNVVASDPNGQAVSVNIKKMSSPKNVVVKKK